MGYFSVYDRSLVQQKADWSESISNCLLYPAAKAFGHTIHLQDLSQMPAHLHQTVSTISRIVGVIFYLLLLPVTLPLTLIGLTVRLLSTSYSEATKNVDQNGYTKIPDDSSDPTRNSNSFVASPYLWPEDLSYTGLDEEGKQRMENFLTALQPHLNGKLPPEIIWEKTETSNIATFDGKTYELPLKVYLFGKEGERRIALNIKTKKTPSAKIGEGNERIVKRSFDPLNGEFIVKKRIEPFEIAIINHCAKSVGIVKNLGILENVKGAAGDLKNLCFEEYYDDSLENLLESKEILTLKEKVNIACQLLTGLSDLHEYIHHGDINERNILFKKNDDEDSYKVGLTDFGYSNLETIGTTAYYNSPEYMDYAKEKATTSSKEEDIQFNELNGKGKDMWGMGVVLARMLLKNGEKPGGMMKWYGDVIMDTIDVSTQRRPSESTKNNFPGSMVRYVSQDVIDDEISLALQIQQLKANQAEAKVLETLWMVVQGMLNVDPINRLTAAVALEFVKSCDF